MSARLSSSGNLRQFLPCSQRGVWARGWEPGIRWGPHSPTSFRLMPSRCASISVGPGLLSVSLCHTHTHTPLAHAHSEYHGNFKLESVLDPKYLSPPHVLEVRKASTKYKALPVLQGEFRVEAETPCFPAPHPAPSAVSAELAHIPAPHSQLDDAGLSPVSPFQSQARV